MLVQFHYVFLLVILIELATGWGPPVMWMWVYKPWNNPYEKYSYIYHKATYKAT